ncbi:hypothetical protein MC885_014550 [Smutsia gigantea]|nr:hypothetical protein MC885_014550 [Smutsia gigantea]
MASQKQKTESQAFGMRALEFLRNKQRLHCLGMLLTDFIKLHVMKQNNLAIALYFSVLSLVVEGINNEMFTAWQKMEAI